VAGLSPPHGTLKSIAGWRTHPALHLVCARHRKAGIAMKTVMGWIDKIVSSLARRKVNKNEGRSN
jgi:hypothetical protein